jgi:hypothetical protein
MVKLLIGQQLVKIYKYLLNNGGTKFKMMAAPNIKWTRLDVQLFLTQRGESLMAKSEAWTRKEGQNPEGGLNAKGRASLKAKGQNIKPPVSKEQAKKSPKSAARRKSYCARSAGQAKDFPKAAADPNSRLNKARRKWDC